MKPISLFGLDRQYKSRKRVINKAVLNVMKSTDFIEGNKVKKLEVELSKFVKSKYCLTCASGTDALLLSLMALDIGPGDYVIVPTISFIASSDVILRVGAIPVFCEIDIETYCMCPVKLKECITHLKENGKIAKAIIHVELFGNPGHINKINKIAEDNNIYTISDNCQSFGRVDGAQERQFNSTISCTSFFPTKPLGCFGDGGAVFTNSYEIYSKINSFKHHGIISGNTTHDFKTIGLNSRLDTMQAAIILEKLKVFDKELFRRNQIARKYTKSLNCVFQKVSSFHISAIALFTIRSEFRTDIIKALKENKIDCKIYYEKPMYLNSMFFGEAVYPNTDYSNSESICANILAIPCHAYLKDKEIERIIIIINEVVNRATNE